MVLSVVRARARAGRRRAGRCGSCSPPTRRPAASLGALWLANTHPEVARGLHRGDRGGGRLLADGRRRPAALSDPDRGEGHRLAETDRRRPGRTRLVPQRRQRDHRTSAAVARIGAYEWPHRITDAQRAFLEAVSEALEIDFDPDRAEETLAKLGSIARMVGATMSNTANPTMLDGRLQAQRHSRRGHRRRSTAGSCPAARTSSSPPSPTCSGTRCATRCWRASRRWRPSSPARWSRPCRPAWSPRIPAPARCPT